VVSAALTLSPIFAVPLGEARLVPCERLNRELEALFLARETDEHRNPMPSHIPQEEMFESRFNLFRWPEPCVQELRKFMLDSVAQTVLQASTLSAEDLARLKFHNHTWFHVTRHAGSFVSHHHPMASWSAVYALVERWSARELPRRLADRLRGRIRIACGRSELPTAAVIDAQTVRGADTVPAVSAGYDAGKKTKGRKRNIATDCLGLLLVVTVTAASAGDRDGAHRLLALLRERFSTISLVWADGGYAGRLVVWAKDVLRLAVTIIKRSDNVAGFVVLPAGGSWSAHSAG